MQTIEYHCPYHGKIEELELPEGYFNFEGEIQCPDNTPVGAIPNRKEAPFILRIKLSGAAITQVERAL